MLHLHSEQPEGRGWQDQGSRHRSISRSSLTVWQMSLTSAFVHGRVLKKFPIFSFPFASDDFGFHTRWMISRKPRAQKKCVSQIVELVFVVVQLARFRDSLPLEIVCHCITQAIEKGETKQSDQSQTLMKLKSAV